MANMVIEFQEGMTLRERFRVYARYCIEGGYQLNKEATREQLIKFFDAFENSNRGAVIYGNTGTGKTLLFQLLIKVIHPSDVLKFKIVSAIDAVEDFNISGHESFRRHKDVDVLYDDIGAEYKGAFYGDKVEVIETLIQQRYNLWKDLGIRTFFTTNYTQEEIEKRYGSRSISRMIEMCAQIKLDDGDKRSLKNFKGFANVYHRPSKEEQDYKERYEKHRKEMSARPYEKHEGLGARLRKQIMQGAYGEILATTRTPSKKTTKKKTK